MRAQPEPGGGTARGMGPGMQAERGSWLCCRAVLVVSPTLPLPVSWTDKPTPSSSSQSGKLPAPGPRPRGASPALRPVGLADRPGGAAAQEPRAPDAAKVEASKGCLFVLFAVWLRVPGLGSRQCESYCASRKTPGAHEAPLGTGRTRVTGRGAQDGRWSTGRLRP